MRDDDSVKASVPTFQQSWYYQNNQPTAMTAATAWFFSNSMQVAWVTFLFLLLTAETAEGTEERRLWAWCHEGSRLCVGKTAWWTITMKKMIDNEQLKSMVIMVTNNTSRKQASDWLKVSVTSLWWHGSQTDIRTWLIENWDSGLSQTRSKNGCKYQVPRQVLYRENIVSSSTSLKRSSKKQSTRKNRAHQDDTSNGSETRQHSRGDRRKSGVVVAEAEQLPSSRLSSENELMNTTYFHERANKEQRWIELGWLSRSLKQQHERDQHQTRETWDETRRVLVNSSIGWDAISHLLPSCTKIRNRKIMRLFRLEWQQGEIISSASNNSISDISGKEPNRRSTWNCIRDHLCPFFWWPQNET
jgi:hypothetical protein